MTRSCLCAACGSELHSVMADLGHTPIANRLDPIDSLRNPQPFYALRVMVCDSCKLVQLADPPAPEESFNASYPYVSSVSSSWMDHCRRHTASSISRFGLDSGSRVVEIGSNDGHLLEMFQENGCQVLGIEPSASVADMAVSNRGVETLVAPFGPALASDLTSRHFQADFLILNNVLAHMPNLRESLTAMAAVLSPDGVVSIEFPHIQPLLNDTLFDTIYHEHYLYLSLQALRPAFEAAGLRVFDVEFLPTHGGSVRLFVCHQASKHPEAPGLAEAVGREHAAGLHDVQTYLDFGNATAKLRQKIQAAMLDLVREGNRVVGYGAAAKVCTLVHYCGLASGYFDFVADMNPAKQGRAIPGTRIEIRPPSAIDEAKPDVIVVLAWNLETEILAQLAHARDWGARFLRLLPEPKLL